jgi:NitT/TauT family transport system ATP-binding protein
VSRPEPAIIVEDLGKRFDGAGRSVDAFRHIDLAVESGEFVCLLGPSGCGKTTLLRCLAGIEEPSTGTLGLAGSRRDAAHLAMVFQQPGLFPWMTVEANLRFALRASPVPAADHTTIIDRLLGRVGLSRYRGFHPYQLSGGMMQRVSLVRAFCVQPRVLLMDEPFAHLDYQNRIILQDLLLELWKDQRQTIVFVTHNINEAIALGDRVLLMPGLPGPFRREIPCPFPRPRDIIALRQETSYQEIVVEITRELKREIERAEEHGG